ncbi:MAG: hypothetical protein E7Z83_09085 [Methanobrevibacter sp.]|nr:hypothetical protein [Methanobrevibacter sp.]
MGVNILSKLKILAIMLVLISALVIVPASFAADNQTDIDVIVNDTDSVSNDFYFDSSIENSTGNGSKYNPYKDLSGYEFQDNTILHFANGEYNLDRYSYVNNVTFIGENTQNTIIKSQGMMLSVGSTLTLCNITFVNLGVQNYGNLTVRNSVFTDPSSNFIYSSGRNAYVNIENSSFVGSSSDSGSAIYIYNGLLEIVNSSFSKNHAGTGGVIYVSDGSLTINNSSFSSNYATSSGGVIYGGSAQININNSSFSNNYAEISGGALQVSGGVLNIEDSTFSGNYADLMGGAISCENDANATIKGSKFSNDNALGDIGGAIYIADSENSLIFNVEFENCTALFGGAVSSLNSHVNLTKVYARNNKAKYDGGAVYFMYGVFTVDSSNLYNNSARNGGALFIDGADIFNIHSNVFSKNSAEKTAGAVYSLFSDTFYDSIFDEILNNTFIDNVALSYNDVYESNMLNLTIGDNNYVLIRYDPSYNGTLPSRYDLREVGGVTGVRSQDNGGNCWSFSSLAALESAVLKATGIAYDFSEENMKNLMSLYSDYGWAMETNLGGYDKMGVGYLTSWLGPVNDIDDVYYGKSKISPVLNSLVHVQNIVFLTRANYTDNDAIKKAIMDYGAVSTSTYWSSAYYKNGKNFYYDGNSSANHAVAIVGWDDNYSKYNFKTTPQGDGAWIIKNSWGTSSGDKGYFYVSYYDTKFAQPGRYVSYAIVLNDTIRFDKNYQYDIAGRTDYFLNSSSTVWYKNKFTATDDEYLAAVSTYFEKDTKWDLTILVNGVKKLVQSGFSNPSYSTITLDKLIPLKAGDLFEAIFKITVDKNAGVPISEAVSLNHETYGVNTSFISYDGKNWVDFYDLEWVFPDHNYASQVACIKAFTILNELDTYVTFDISSSHNPCEISATVHTKDGAIVKSGVVTFNVEGKDIDVDIEDSVAKLVYLFEDAGNNTVKASFSGEGYIANSSSVNVPVKQVYINANDTSIYYSSDIAYSVTLTDDDNNPIGGKEIKFIINGKELYSRSDLNGIATVNPILNVGNYTVTVSFAEGGKSIIRNIEVKTTIALPEFVKYTFNSKYSVTLFDTNGNLLKNSQISIIIGDEEYVVSTNSKGVASLNVDLTSGTYSVNVVNPVTSEIKTQKISVVDRITGNKAVTMYYGAGSLYTVRVFDDNGNPAAGVNVKFTINGKTYTRQTNANGYVSYKIIQQAGTYTISATYKNYKVSNKVVVKPTLVLSTKTVKKSKTFTYKVKLLNNKGKILKNKKVTVKFKGKTYKAKTNSKGIATFKINAYSKTGKFTLTASYGSAKVSKTITVKK